MDVKTDRKRFDQFQQKVMEEMIRAIAGAVKETDLDEEDGLELTKTIAFQIAALFDGSANISLKGKKFWPVVAFAESAKKNLILTAGVTSNGHALSTWMHEGIQELVDDIFDEEEEDED